MCWESILFVNSWQTVDKKTQKTGWPGYPSTEKHPQANKFVITMWMGGGSFWSTCGQSGHGAFYSRKPGRQGTSVYLLWPNQSDCGLSKCKSKRMSEYLCKNEKLSALEGKVGYIALEHLGQGGKWKPLERLFYWWKKIHPCLSPHSSWDEFLCQWICPQQPFPFILSPRISSFVTECFSTFCRSVTFHDVHCVLGFVICTGGCNGGP